jgi:hypothetical protein
MTVLSLAISLLVAAAASPQPEDAVQWSLSVREAAAPQQWGQKLWLGVRNDNQRAVAVCVAGTSYSGPAGGALSSVTHACTTEGEAHLVLPGQSYYVATSVKPHDRGARITFSINLVTWRADEEVTSEHRPWQIVSGEWVKP